MKDQNHSANLQMAALWARVKRSSLAIIQRLVEKTITDSIRRP
ncbi:hypothetical protein ALQ78_101597 [Pseudomonas syringae pv. aptata]|jgi:hypothetical protein|nr:Unknown protein sequence [Pseudomonas syringae pv. syringae]KPY36207.1 hypothetical protein ALO65_102145 [Pseudomonas syringae pv. papulans]RMM40409.1 hypothetical protein ALQ78_101597 [Pseudomonas syringae pv. aptata]RMS60636.1 hypothetical protein ALP63_102529 [Pseudomonas syringae pv. aceris]RMN49209.1 hypothetical protein ALQ60_102025 [Pseudomonas syringae pv. papulans]